ncbi:ABC transporter permease [Patescibacteria group bacterium]|nr:ABC transporter permease [Patescibacteria group bacterium]MBU1663699.1 ABC transporter permease [Patescibacteria group bacterium]
MFLLSFLRVIKFSLQDIVRNIWLSIITIIIITLALFSVNLLLAVNILTTATVSSVKEKVDISLYLKSDAQENLILALKSEISNLDSVKQIDYISKQAAIESFREKHKNNPEILQALLELGKNPLSPSLIIKPKDINNYDELIVSLNKINNNIIESRNFDDHKAILAKINNIAEKANQAGLFVSSLFILITILVVYNAVCVAIFTHKREIGIMKLVGASTWFIRAPYLISGMIYAFLGVITIIIIMYPFLSLIQPYLATFFSGFEVNLLDYYNSNFLLIFGLEFLAASLINVLASLVAVGKYSKV